MDRSIHCPDDFIETNVTGTFNLLVTAREFWVDELSKHRILHVSTDEVFGSLGSIGKFLESIPYATNSPYSPSKAASNHLVRAWHHTYGMNWSQPIVQITTVLINFPKNCCRCSKIIVLRTFPYLFLVMGKIYGTDCLLKTTVMLWTVFFMREIPEKHTILADAMNGAISILSAISAVNWTKSLIQAELIYAKI